MVFLLPVRRRRRPHLQAALPQDVQQPQWKKFRLFGAGTLHTIRLSFFGGHTKRLYQALLRRERAHHLPNWSRQFLHVGITRDGHRHGQPQGAPRRQPRAGAQPCHHGHCCTVFLPHHPNQPSEGHLRGLLVPHRPFGFFVLDNRLCW